MHKYQIIKVYKNYKINDSISNSKYIPSFIVYEENTYVFQLGELLC